MNSEGVVKLERVRVRCPGCGEEVLASVSDGRVRGYCAVARQYVNFPIETQRGIGKNPTAKIFASGQDPDPDEVVRDYLAGDKTIVIQDRYKISPGRMYRVLRSAGVKLRMTGRCQGYYDGGVPFSPRSQPEDVPQREAEANRLASNTRLRKEETI